MSDIITGVSYIWQPMTLLFIFMGVTFGVIIGIIPAIGGMTAMAILLPLTYGLDAQLAVVLMIAALSVSSTGGSITAVLMNIPGDDSNAPACLDGFPMTKSGHAGRAVAIALTASALGGLLGAMMLALLVPAVRPIVMAFGAPETMMLAVMGISFIATLSGKSMTKGMIAGLIGILLATIGYHPTTAITRYAFGWTYLFDGLPIIPMSLGMFGVAPVAELIGTGTSFSKVGNLGVTTQWSDTIQGIKDVFRYPWTVFRSFVIGTIVGILPGIGGSAAAWIAYGQAKAVSKHPEKFGTGAPEGIVASQSADNCERGGALLTTLAFGIPGSSAMVLVLAALLLHGVVVGPQFLKEHMSMAFTLTGTLAFANVIAAAILLVLSRQLAKITYIPGHIIGPFILVLMALGAFNMNGQVIDVYVTFVAGALALIMQRFGYSTVSLFVGFVLGEMTERYFLLAWDISGLAFLLKPIVLVLIALTILGTGYRQVAALVKLVVRMTLGKGGVRPA